MEGAPPPLEVTDHPFKGGVPTNTEGDTPTETEGKAHLIRALPTKSPKSIPKPLTRTATLDAGFATSMGTEWMNAPTSRHNPKGRAIPNNLMK